MVYFCKKLCHVWEKNESSEMIVHMSLVKLCLPVIQTESYSVLHSIFYLGHTVSGWPNELHMNIKHLASLDSFLALCVLS